MAERCFTNIPIYCFASDGVSNVLIGGGSGGEDYGRADRVHLLKVNNDFSVECTATCVLDPRTPACGGYIRNKNIWVVACQGTRAGDPSSLHILRVLSAKEASQNLKKKQEASGTIKGPQRGLKFDQLVKVASLDLKTLGNPSSLRVSNGGDLVAIGDEAGVVHFVEVGPNGNSLKAVFRKFIHLDISKNSERKEVVQEPGKRLKFKDEDGITDLCWSPDDKSLIVVTNDEQCHVFNIMHNNDKYNDEKVQLNLFSTFTAPSPFNYSNSKNKMKTAKGAPLTIRNVHAVPVSAVRGINKNASGFLTFLLAHGKAQPATVLAIWHVNVNGGAPPVMLTVKEISNYNSSVMGINEKCDKASIVGIKGSVDIISLPDLTRIGGHKDLHGLMGGSGAAFLHAGDVLVTCAKDFTLVVAPGSGEGNKNGRGFWEKMSMAVALVIVIAFAIFVGYSEHTGLNWKAFFPLVDLDKKKLI